MRDLHQRACRPSVGHLANSTTHTTGNGATRHLPYNHLHATRTQPMPHHGVRVVKSPGPESSSRFTALFEAIRHARLTKAAAEGVGEQLDCSLG